jgi:HK97 family phage portal protein
LLTRAEYDAWCEALEARRANDKAQAQVDPFGGLPTTEIAPGRGNLNYTSGGWGFVPEWQTSLAVIGRTVSYAKLYRSQPWVAAAVRTLLELAVRVPLRAYERIGDADNERRLLAPKDDPIAAVIAAPWDRGSSVGLTLSQLGPMLVHGNAVTQIIDGAAGKFRFVPKDWRFAMPIMPWRDFLAGFRFDTDLTGEFGEQNVPIDQVLHCSWWDPVGPTQQAIAASPLEQLGVTLTIEDAAQRWQRAMFANGGRPPSALIMAPEFLSMKPGERDQAKAQMRADLVNVYGGPENAGKPALLPPGVDWKAVGQTTVEAELVKQRQINREEVAGVYRIPPPMLGIMEKANYSNVESLREMVYPEHLGPKLILIESTINAQVLRDLLGRPEIFVEYDFAAVLRGNLLAHITALRQAIGSGLLTPNEGREDLGKMPSDQDGMDEFYLPMNNLSPVGEEALPVTGNVPMPGAPPNQPAPPTQPGPNPNAEEIAEWEAALR